MDLIRFFIKIKRVIWPWSKRCLSVESMKMVSSLEEFQKIVEIERCRVNRNGKSFAIIVFNLEKGQLEIQILSRLVQGIIARARISDQIGWYDYSKLGLILPETSSLGAQKFIQDLYHQHSSDIPKPPIDLYIYPLLKDSIHLNSKEQT
jgi:hypothetical protein